MRLRRLINNEPLKIPLYFNKTFGVQEHPNCHSFFIRGLNIPPHACEGGSIRASSPSSRAPRAFLRVRHNSYAPTTKGRMRLDKNSYPSGTLLSQMVKHWLANKLTALCGGRLVY